MAQQAFIPTPVLKTRLVLSRAKDEQIVLDGGRIVLTVVETQRSKTRLLVEAPPEVSIDRMEVHLAKQAAARGKAQASAEMAATEAEHVELIQQRAQAASAACQAGESEAPHGDRTPEDPPGACAVDDPPRPA